MENPDRRKFLKILGSAAAGASMGTEAMAHVTARPERDHKESMPTMESPYAQEAEASAIVDKFLRTLNEIQEARTFSQETLPLPEIAAQLEAYLDAYSSARAKHYGEHVHRTPELDEQAFTYALVRGALMGLDPQIHAALWDMYIERSEVRVERSLGKSGDSGQAGSENDRDIG